MTMTQTATIPRARSMGRVTELDALLEVKGLALPDQVRTTLERRRQVQAFRLPPLPNPGALAHQANEEGAWAIVEGTGDIVFDLSGLHAARAAEADARDCAERLSLARTRVDDHVSRVVDQNVPALLKALGNHYSKAADRFVAAARRLPAELTPEVALKLGDPVRTDWLIVADGTNELAQLRALVAAVADQYEREVPGAKVRSALWCKNPALWQRRTPHSRTGNYSLPGAEGSREFLHALALLVDAGEWWCPSLRQAREYVAGAGWKD